MKTMCGCARHPLNLSRDEVVRYQNSWWLLKCLFVKVDKRMPKIISKFVELEKKVTEMERVLEQMPCVTCGFSAGPGLVYTDQQPSR